MSEHESDNFAATIHDEGYHRRFDPRNLNHETAVFMGGRRCEQLNGLWSFVPDQFDMGLRDNWHLPRTPDEHGVMPPWDYSVDDGRQVMLPACWNTIAPELRWLEGSCWFARRFGYERGTPDERVFLRVGAANYDAKVFLNGVFLGNHCGGSTPFFVELTGTLRQENVLQLCVNNTRTHDRVPMKNTDWFNWGGVYREIELVRVPPAFVTQLRLHLVPDGTYRRIAVSIAVSDAQASDSVRLAIPELQIDAVLDLAAGRCTAELEVEPELWSPANPRLYHVSARFRDDAVTDRVGFREIRVRGTEILLNGEPIWLRGVSVHEDDAKLGKATSREDIERRFAHAKELGCVFMRLAHYPHHELAATIADEVGLLLWEEIPVYWAIDFANPATYGDARNQLLELIDRDYNRASVVIWSVGNENADTDERLAFMSKLAQTAHETDPSRLVSAACLVNLQALRIEDRLADYLDVIGLNEYYGWYATDFNELVELGRRSQPDKPVIITEFGAGSKAGHHGPETDKFTEEYAARLYERQLETISTLDYVKGITPWILYDFAAPRRTNRFQDGFNRKGLIAEDKETRKLPFYVLQRYYREMARGRGERVLDEPGAEIVDAD
ncbi:MAG: glycoside hydrolase family 2 protein [Spirochaetota bacterium]